jgi:adenine-specific DNA-methyltransferase
VPARRTTSSRKKHTETYDHGEGAVLRPEAGTQIQFRKKKPSKTYRYDSSLSPSLDWDGQNGARELGEWLLAQIEDAAALDPPHRFARHRSFGDSVIEGLDDAGRRPPSSVVTSTWACPRSVTIR